MPATHCIYEIKSHRHPAGLFRYILGWPHGRFWIRDRGGRRRECLCHRLHYIWTTFQPRRVLYQRSLAGVGAQEGRPSCGGLPWFNTGDAFVTKLNPGGSQVVFSTYLGGVYDDAGMAIALDSAQNVIVGGFTLSPNFPTTAGVFQSMNEGIDPQNIFFNTGDGFVTKLNNTGAALLYSTYLGGSGDDGVTGIAALGDGTVWVTGATSSQNFPVTANAVQRGYGGYYVLPFAVEQSIGDAFATHINAGATAILYSTFIGGSQNDFGGAIQVDASGLVYVSGFTDSPNFPVSSNAVQPKLAGDGDCNGADLMCGTQYFQYGDGFVTVIDPNKSTIVFSTYLGGSRDDSLLGLALDGSGGVWAAGGTHSTDIPLSAKAFQGINAGRTDSWLVHLTGLAATGPVLSALSNAASNAGGAVSPGMIFVGYGSSIGPGFCREHRSTPAGDLPPAKLVARLHSTACPRRSYTFPRSRLPAWSPMRLRGKPPPK